MDRNSTTSTARFIRKGFPFRNTGEAVAATLSISKHRFTAEEITVDPGWRVNVREFSEDGVIFKDSNVTVEAFRHEHGSLPSYGFRFVSTDRVIVWSGDGKQGAAFQAAAMKVKRLVLIHESNYSNSYDPEALLKEVSQFYTGDVISSRDGGIF